MVVAPIFASCIVYGYTQMRESGGAASHFAHAIRRAKNRFTPDRAAGGKWPSKTDKEGEESLADQHDELTDQQMANDSISDVYK